MTRKRIGTTFLAMTLAAIFFFFTALNETHAQSHNKENNITQLVRDTQDLLSHHNYPPGPLDGRCGNKTIKAIEKYVATLAQKPSGTACSVQVLTTLKDNLQSAKTTDIATLNLLSSKMEALTDDVNKIKSSFSQLNDSIYLKIKDNMYTTLYNSLSSQGISAFVTSIILFITILIFVYGVLEWHIRRSHRKALKSSKKILLEMIDSSKNEMVAMAETAHARIYTMFSAHCINLYKDFQEPAGKNRHMYKSYLEIAVYMSTYGYLHAVRLQKSLEKRNIEESKVQKGIFRATLNNYVYYLSEMNRNEDRSNIEEGIHKLEKIVNDEPNNKESWQYHDTLAWANLQLRRTPMQESLRTIQNLINRKDIDLNWRAELVKRYDFYNLCRKNSEETIKLSIDPELSEFIKKASEA